MIKEENLPENASQADETPREDRAVGDEETAAMEVDLSIEPDSESQFESAEAPATEAVSEATVAEGGDGVETMPAASIPLEESISDGERSQQEALRQENEALKAKMDELSGQCEAFKTQSVRIAADFDNFRKRTAKEKEDLEAQIKRTTIIELLPVVDNFERARSHIKPQDEGEMTIHKSYQSVYKQLVDCLKRIGVSPMRPEGQLFDPNLHEAVMREPTSEQPEGTVIEQLMRGYFIGDRVLRHAMVKVAAAEEPVITSEESNSDSAET